MLKEGLVAIGIVLAGLTEVATGQVPLSAECVSEGKDKVDGGPLQPVCPRVVGATPRNADLFVDVSPRFPLAPEGALKVFERRSEQQVIELRAYTATTLVKVELPDMSRWGEFELRRVYVAPKTLEFVPVRFTGDNFVKTNIIARLLQSEVTHLQDAQLFATAINGTNYKISYRGTTQIDGRLVHAYQLKPRKRQAGLFEGSVFLDAFTGRLVRNEGRLLKTPSWVLKKINFVQDYEDLDGFVFLQRAYSEVSTRLVGRAIVDIQYYDYRFPLPSSPSMGGQTLAEANAAVSRDNPSQ